MSIDPQQLLLELERERVRIQQIISRKGRRKKPKGENNTRKRNVMQDKDRIFLQEHLRKYGPVVDMSSLNAAHISHVWGRELYLNEALGTVQVGYRQLTVTFSLYEYGKQPKRYAFCQCLRCEKIFRVQAAKLKWGVYGCPRCAQYYNARTGREFAKVWSVGRPKGSTNANSMAAENEHRKIEAQLKAEQSRQEIEQNLSQIPHRAF
jgi:hypothetical protein